MRILMLGNSLTTANEMPCELARLTGARVDVHARGGARLAEHLNSATKMGARSQAVLGEGGIDFVVLQEMSNGPVSSTEAYLRSAIKLCELARAAGAVPVVYATWPYADDCPKYDKLGITRKEMAAAMNAAFRRAAAEGEALLADVSGAFLSSSEHSRLYAPDGVHPSPEGSQLAARVIADTISASRLR